MKNSDREIENFEREAESGYFPEMPPTLKAMFREELEPSQAQPRTDHNGNIFYPFY
ncbi:MAG TPA: hypothetical protein VLE72_03630 [Candidatus Saccharimonadales bacterium]|nr:hypothetical protein [Candidatus Saccharimonadales bacterium]